MRYPGAVTHKELPPVSTGSLAQNQNGSKPCVFCGPEPCIDAYAHRHGLPTIEELADLRLRNVQFIEIAASEGVTVDGC